MNESTVENKVSNLDDTGVGSQFSAIVFDYRNDGYGYNSYPHRRRGYRTDHYKKREYS